tara:strand:- start:74 stop:556 length:483 start_codon:yes stop_codon:yes gene_type:complete
MKSAKMIKEQFPYAEFILVGDIDNFNKSKIKISEINKYYKYVKYISFKDDVRKFIIECDCFVLPSYREGTSRSLLEAASMGKPIVTTNVPGCNNIVIDNYNGYLCKEKDVISLFNSLKKMLLTEYKLRVKMGQNSRVKVMKEFDINIINKKILKEIDIDA